MQAKSGFYEMLCAYNEVGRVIIKVFLADLVQLIEVLCGDCFHFSPKYTRIIMPYAWLLNQINKICVIER